MSAATDHAQLKRQLKIKTGTVQRYAQAALPSIHALKAPLTRTCCRSGQLFGDPIRFLHASGRCCHPRYQSIRYLKELTLYKKEVEDYQRKLDKLHADGVEGWDLKNGVRSSSSVYGRLFGGSQAFSFAQRNLLAESQKMIPDTEGKLQKAVQDLREVVVSWNPARKRVGYPNKFCRFKPSWTQPCTRRRNTSRRTKCSKKPIFKPATVACRFGTVQ